MKIRKMSLLIIVALLATGSIGQAQTAFHRYALLVSVTGGPARAQYSTRDNSGSGISDLKSRENIKGEADPLIVEFGITNKLGIGSAPVVMLSGWMPINFIITVLSTQVKK